MVPVVAMVSLKGGVGRTTLTASLASGLVQAGRRCLAVDLDPQNGLAAHFGRAPGAVNTDRRLEMVERRAQSGRGEPAFVSLPFPVGSAAEESDPGEDAAWLGRRLQALAPTGCDQVLLDTPAQRGGALRGALAVADLVLVVVTPEPACYATLPEMEELLAETRGQRPDGLGALYVVNRFDASRAVGRDVVAALRAAFPERLAPVMVHEDEAVREAVGRHHTVFRETTHSQVIADLTELAEWLSLRVTARSESPAVRAAGAGS
jgi:cellulose synthase operon protein YhjQ